MIEAKRFKKVFGEPLAGSGYQRRGQTWYKAGRGVTVVLNLQKSNYSTAYFLNLGLILHALAGDELLPEPKCHIRSRATSVLNDQADRIDMLLSLDYSGMSEDEHAASISEFVVRHLVPYCEGLLDIQHVREALARGNFKRALVRREAAEAIRPRP